MRVMVPAIAVLFALIAGRGQAQPPSVPAPPVVPALPPIIPLPSAIAAPPVVPVPPIQVLPGAFEDGGLNGGQEVSRPLSPVEPPSEPQPEGQPDGVQRIQNIQEQQQYARRGPLGPGWDDMEFLLWWPRSQALPPLVSGSRSGSTPTLNNPNTAVLIGGHALENQGTAGGRFTLGFAVNPEQTIGIEGVYFFLGSRTLKGIAESDDNPSATSLGLPFRNAVTGKPDAYLLAVPGVSNGSAYVASTTRVQGAEGNFVANLYDGTSVKLNGLVGYRFLQVNEGIAIVDESTPTVGRAQYGPIYDGFDGHNAFNGGQFGLHADLNHNVVFCELTAKVALGVTSESMRIDGATTVYSPGGSQVVPGGVYALPSNMGSYSRGVFAVAPEGTLKLGLKLGDETRLFVGYDFLYLSDLVRPSDLIDRTLNPVQIPSLAPGATFSGPDRPRLPVARSDFWVQGLTIGLETRY